jgi:diacylglycerol kinase family enzyme
VRQYVDESNCWRLERFRRFNEVQSLLGLPRFAFLKLGTGNGLAAVVGASDPVDDLRRIIDYGPGRTHAVPLIDVGNDRCLIAGLGYDSMLLNDYNWLKQRTRNRLLKPLMHTLLGYFAATFSRTLPRVLSGRPIRVEARVTNRGKAFYVDPRRGDAVQEIPVGATLFEGPAAMIGAGTMPYFGFGLRVYPFANIMPNMMHLRIARLGPLRTIANLPSIWRGAFRDADNVFDFLVNDVHVELEKPFPFQHSGDDQGLRDQIDLKIADDDLELVDYLRPRPLTWA